MTKDDLKTLALLPKAIHVLRKLAGEAEELRHLTSSLGMTSAAPASGAAPTRAGGEATPPEIAPALTRSFPKPMAGLRERLPDFGPPVPTLQQLASRAALQAKIEAIQHGPERAMRLGQFSGQMDVDDEEMDG